MGRITERDSRTTGWAGVSDLAKLTSVDTVEKAHPLGPVIDEHSVGWIACHSEQHPIGFGPLRSSADSFRPATHEGHFE
jgi:hypothetical protein